MPPQRNKPRKARPQRQLTPAAPAPAVRLDTADAAGGMLLTDALNRRRAVPLSRFVKVMEVTGVIGVAFGTMAAMIFTRCTVQDTLAICLAYLWAGIVACVGLKWVASRQGGSLTELAALLGPWLSMVMLTVSSACLFAVLLKMAAMYHYADVAAAKAA